MTTKTGIEQALEKYEGSPTKLAAAVGGGVIRQHVEHWRKSGVVPADKAPDVALATGIAVDLLNPSVNWDAVRNMPNTADIAQPAATPAFPQFPRIHMPEPAHPSAAPCCAAIEPVAAQGVA